MRSRQWQLADTRKPRQTRDVSKPGYCASTSCLCFSSIAASLQSPRAPTPRQRRSIWQLRPICRRLLKFRCDSTSTKQNETAWSPTTLMPGKCVDHMGWQSISKQDQSLVAEAQPTAGRPKPHLVTRRGNWLAAAPARTKISYSPAATANSKPALWGISRTRGA